MFSVTELKNTKIIRTFSANSLLIVALIFLSSSFGHAEEKEDGIVINIDISSVKAIVLDPEKVLEDVDEFWKTDSAYILSNKWHTSSKYPKDMERWEERLTSLASMTLEERQDLPYFKSALQVEEKKNLFYSKAVPHIKSFLPDTERVNFESTVYITAFTTAYSFSMDGQMIIDVASDYYRNDINFLLSELTHELFHVGYGQIANDFQENPLEDEARYNYLSQLQNEGIATYVGYKIQDVFPGSDPDHVMMDKPDVVKEKIAAVNEIFSQPDSVDLSKRDQMSWDVGVMARAYYVTGAHMARTIDQHLGRAALVATLVIGPLNFVDVYNKLVPKEEQIL
jgi:hypothetical protein